MSSLFIQIGNKVRAFLEDKNMSQTDFAQQLGISKQVMSKIVLGKKAINVEEITKIASAMNVSLDYLIKYEKPQLSNPFLVMMGSVSNPNTKDYLSFLDHVMDEMIELDKLLQI